MRDEAAEAQREKMTLFNEQKRCESQIQRLSSEVHLANQAMDKMRTEAVSLRSKNNDLRDERSKQHWKNVTPRSLIYDRCWNIAIRSWIVWNSQRPPLKRSGPDFSSIPLR